VIPSEIVNTADSFTVLHGFALGSKSNFVEHLPRPQSIGSERELINTVQVSPPPQVFASCETQPLEFHPISESSPYELPSQGAAFFPQQAFSSEPEHEQYPVRSSEELSQQDSSSPHDEALFSVLASPVVGIGTTTAYESQAVCPAFEKPLLRPLELSEHQTTLSVEHSDHFIDRTYPLEPLVATEKIDLLTTPSVQSGSSLTLSNLARATRRSLGFWNSSDWSILTRYSKTPPVSPVPFIRTSGVIPRCIWYALLVTLVICSAFHINRDNVNINETSACVDPSPLYNVNQEQQNQVCTGGSHSLWHLGWFSEGILLFFPPAVRVLRVPFNCNHNWVTQKHLAIDGCNSRQNLATAPADGAKANSTLVIDVLVRGSFNYEIPIYAALDYRFRRGLIETTCKPALNAAISPLKGTFNATSIPHSPTLPPLDTLSANVSPYRSRSAFTLSTPALGVLFPFEAIDPPLYFFEERFEIIEAQVPRSHTVVGRVHQIPSVCALLVEDLSPAVAVEFAGLPQLIRDTVDKLVPLVLSCFRSHQYPPGYD
jgi:hypothetical protein